MSEYYDFEDDQRKAKKSEDETAKAARLQQEREDLKEVLSTPHGRRFIWKYLEANRVLKISAEHSGSWTYFNEGRRSAANKLLSQILKASPESYLLMMKEANGDLK